MTLSQANEPLSRETFETAALIKDHPPRFSHKNKELIHQIACPPGAIHRGTLEVLRFPQLDLPDLYQRSGTSFDVRGDVFQYEDPEHWHLNFAHNDLFCMYGGPLLAQDELQVAEHPALASLREALISGKAKTVPSTVENGAPTPVLIKGVERRARIDSGAVYGHRFARADTATITRATTPIDPPAITNLIAIEAPDGGRGPYYPFELRYILSTAYSGFRAAKLSTNDHPTVIHTGFWGCGAYGGDRVLMTMLQLIAARLANVDRLVFHTVTPDGAAPYREGKSRVDTLENQPTSKLLARILEMKFEWGVSDGT